MPLPPSLSTATAASFLALVAACGGSPSNQGSGGGDSGGGDDGATVTEGGTPGDGGTTSDGAAGDSGGSHDAGHDGGHGDAGGDGGAMTGLHVVMGSGGTLGHIVDGMGNVVQLHGVDRSGTEYMCLNGGFFDGPADQTALNAMIAWHVNAVRVPLNADCWLAINGAPAMYSGAAYQSAIKTWVDLITSNGMVAIVDLHWTAPGTYLAKGQTPMADADHAPTFWGQVAKTFASNGAVVFDLFNEPYISDWTCWTSGGMCAQWNGSSATGASYAVAGMAQLLKAVRGAGANNVVILGGLSYSSDMSKWVQSVQSIPTLPAPLDGISIANVAVSWHAYDFNSAQSGCPSQYNGYASTCNTAAVTAMKTAATSVLSAGFPLVIGESGISAYNTSSAMPFSASQLTEIETWYDDLLTWTEGQGQSYLAWSWNTDTPPILLTDYTGAPSPYFGVTYQKHLQKF